MKKSVPISSRDSLFFHVWKTGILCSFCFLFLGLSAQAQSQQVRGSVKAAEDGSSLPGVSVLIKGSTKGTTTDNEGNYQLEIPTGKETLVFSFIGYTTQEVDINGRTTILIQLAADTKALQEVVVTALGIEKDKKTIGYAVQEVKGADLIKAREPNPINSLVGKVAGLTVGSSAELLRRPNISLRGNQDLLFVVDGVPINSDTWNVSPDDIESYTVLKGPNATALYGFRGRNGAILITTKKGTKDKRGFAVEFNSSTMFDKGFNAIPDVQDTYGPGDHGAYGFVDGRNGGLNDGDYDVWGPPLDGRLLPQYDSPIDPQTGKRIPTPWIARGKDNLSRFLQTGILSTNNVSVSASNEKTDVRFSLSHSFQRGIVPNTKLNITNFNGTIGVNFSKKLRFESNINYNRQYTPNYPDVNYGPNSIIYNIIIWGGADWNIDDMRNYWQYKKEGIQQIYAEYQRYNNPYFSAYEWLRGHYKTDVYGYTSLRYKFNDHLEATLRTQVTTWDLLRNEKFPTSAGSYSRDERLGDYREDRRNLFENNTDLLVKFDHNISPSIGIKAWAGAALRTFRYNSSYATTNYLNVPASSLNPSGFAFTNSRDPIKGYSYNAQMQVGSAYYSVDLSFRNFLTLSTTGRMDKLSTLPTGHNTFFYPSVAISTAISDYVNLPDFISFLKVRGSYANVKDGLTQSTIGAAYSNSGNPLSYGDSYESSYDGPTYQNAAVYTTPLVYHNQPAATYTNTLNNPSLKPNSSSQFEVGGEIRFLQNRLGLDVTHFSSNDGPRIFSLPTSEASGYTSQLVNGIETRKTGWEVTINGSPIQNTDGLNWEILANWSTFKEVLTDIYPGVNSLNTYFQVGDRVDKYYDRAYVKTPDGQLINDGGGRPVRNPVPQFLGHLNPDWVWGIQNKFRYKNVLFSFQFDGRVGGVITNYIQRQTFRGGRNIATTEGIMGITRLNDTQGLKTVVGPGVVIANGATIRFDQDGNITNYTELEFAPNTNATYLQDYISRYYQDSEFNLMSRTFAKLREVTIGYSLPSGLLKRTFIKQASLSLVARNLLYWAERKDIDLDQYVNFGRTTGTNDGYSSLQTPTTRRYGFNLNLVF